jgi:hypothetical protein
MGILGICEGRILAEFVTFGTGIWCTFKTKKIVESFSVLP